MNYFKDCPDKIAEILDSLEADGRIRYVRIPKFKIRNKAINTQQIVKDVFVISTGPYSSKPLILQTIVKDNDCYISHLDISHSNISSPDSVTIGGYKLSVRRFCNTVLQHHIWERGKVLTPILAGNLMEQNPNDAYRSVYSVDADKNIQPRYYNDGSCIKSTATLGQLITKYKDATNASLDLKRRLAAIIKALKADHNKCYCVYQTYTVEDGCETYADIISKDDLFKSNVFPSNYYRTYDWSTCNDEVNKDELLRDIDIGCLGCGSASSQIIDQVARLNYFDKYLLLDFDTVERKNIRNQIYSDRNVGEYKTSALMTYIHRTSWNQNPAVETVTKKIEDYHAIAFDRYKYLISGFDNIEARKYVLDKIKTGEIKTKYLIDARYDRLTADLYMVDVDNDGELEYYEKLLDLDDELFKANTELSTIPIKDLDDESIIAYLKSKDVFTNRCSDMRDKIGCALVCGIAGCETSGCKKLWIDAIRNSDTQYRVPYNSCIEQNIVHIYKLVSTWVTSNIVSIQTDDKKLFTHVSLTAEPLPKAIVIRK